MNNQITPSDINTRKIPLTKGQFTIVDSDDYENLVNHKWLYGGGRYAARNVHYRDTNGKRHTKVVWMHREIAKTPIGMLTDHINGNGLDNRKINLRNVTPQENSWNSKMPSHNTSGYKGVSERNGRWEASITIENKKKHLGYFPSKEEAARSYNNAAKIYFKEFALLNDLPYFEYEHLETIDEVLTAIKKCEGKHSQQTAFSTFHSALTQVCFGCKKVRSTIKR